MYASIYNTVIYVGLHMTQYMHIIKIYILILLYHMVNLKYGYFTYDTITNIHNTVIYAYDVIICTFNAVVYTCTLCMHGYIYIHVGTVCMYMHTNTLGPYNRCTAHINNCNHQNSCNKNDPTWR